MKEIHRTRLKVQSKSKPWWTTQNLDTKFGWNVYNQITQLSCVVCLSIYQSQNCSSVWNSPEVCWSLSPCIEQGLTPHLTGPLRETAHPSHRPLGLTVSFGTGWKPLAQMNAAANCCMDMTPVWSRGPILWLWHQCGRSRGPVLCIQHQCGPETPFYGYDTDVVQRFLLPLNTYKDQEERTCQILFIHLRDQIVSNFLFPKRLRRKGWREFQVVESLPPLILTCKTLGAQQRKQTTGESTLGQASGDTNDQRVWRQGSLVWVTWAV